MELEWGQVLPTQMHRGRVTTVFSKENTDRNGKYGYGFVDPIDERGDPVKGAARMFFHVTQRRWLEVRPGRDGEARLYRTRTKRQQELPKCGDVVYYEQTFTGTATLWCPDHEYTDLMNGRCIVCNTLTISGRVCDNYLCLSTYHEQDPYLDYYEMD